MEDSTPDHAYFCRVRKNLGERRIEEMFSPITDEAFRKQIIKRLRSFVGASAIRRKEAKWKKRDEDRGKGDKLIEEGIKASSPEKRSAEHPSANSPGEVTKLEGISPPIIGIA